MTSVGIGIIGSGGIADAHAAAAQIVGEARLAAVLSRDESRGQSFLARHRADDGIVHTQIENFVADPSVDIVIVCSPDRLHFEQASACLMHDKHLLLEKPMATSVDEAASLVDLAKSRQLTLAIGFRLRFHAGHIALRAKVHAGDVGRVRHMRVMWSYPQVDDSNWRAHQELGKWWSLGAVGIHCIDFARWIAADLSDWRQFSSISNNNMWNGEHDETAVIAAQLSSGSTVEVVSSVQFGRQERVELFGDEGVAICEGTFGREGTGAIIINDHPLDYEPRNPFVSQLENVIANVTTATPLRADGAVGLRAVRDLLLASDI